MNTPRLSTADDGLHASLDDFYHDRAGDLRFDAAEPLQVMGGPPYTPHRAPRPKVERVTCFGEDQDIWPARMLHDHIGKETT